MFVSFTFSSSIPWPDDGPVRLKQLCDFNLNKTRLRWTVFYVFILRLTVRMGCNRKKGTIVAVHVLRTVR
jgi:hypothetical protein